MKKVLGVLFLFIAVILFQANRAFALDVNFNNGIYNDDLYDYSKIWEQNGKFEQKVNEVGFKLLNVNNFPFRVVFNVDRKNKARNANASYLDNSVTIYNSFFPYIDSDDELAAILAHEIAHVRDYQKGYLTYINMQLLNPKHYEYRADITAIDYMVKAGYNPLAEIAVQNKAMSEGKGMWYSLSHPKTSKRLLKEYQYIMAKYPQYINNGYDNIYYVNFLQTSQKARAKKNLL